MEIPLLETQAQLLDRIVGEAAFGGSRAEVLRVVLHEHVAHLAAGGPPHENSGTHILKVRRPRHGKLRYRSLLPPITGVAIPVHKGEVLRIIQKGAAGQCVDFNAFNLHDYKEHLDCGFTRTRQPTRVRPGDLIWTGAPRGRPILAITSIPETCDVFLRGHRCNAVFFEREWGLPDHPNCQDTLAEAIGAYGLTPDDVHDSYNLWMTTEQDEKGRLVFPWNPAQPGDYVDFLALMDTLSVPVVCASSDLTGISNYDFSPIEVQVYASSESTMDVVGSVERTWGSYHSQRTPDSFRIGEIRQNRRLEQDPSYKAHFIARPRQTKLAVRLTDEDQTLLSALIRRGSYGSSTADALKIAFMRWYQANRKTDTYTALAFQD